MFARDRSGIAVDALFPIYPVAATVTSPSCLLLLLLLSPGTGEGRRPTGCDAVSISVLLDHIPDHLVSGLSSRASSASSARKKIKTVTTKQKYGVQKKGTA